MNKQGKEVGGAGTGERTSLTQYLALELSRQIRGNPNYPVEGVFISNQNVRELSRNRVNEISSRSDCLYKFCQVDFSGHLMSFLKHVYESLSLQCSCGLVILVSL